MTENITDGLRRNSVPPLPPEQILEQPEKNGTVSKGADIDE